MFPAGSTCPQVLWILSRVSSFRVQDSHFLWLAFPNHSAMITLPLTVLTPQKFLPEVWPLSLSLATTREISFDFFSSAYLDVSVQRVPSVTLCIHVTVTSFSCEVSPFGYLRVNRLFAPNRSFSQLITSFFGSQCPGIPLVLFLA